MWEVMRIFIKSHDSHSNALLAVYGKYDNLQVNKPSYIYF